MIGGSMRALIVDGDQDLLDIMTYALRREGYEVVAATTGPQGLDRLRDDHPDIVVLDLKLPAARRLRGLPPDPPGVRGADHHGLVEPRGAGRAARAPAGRRRLRHQAVQLEAARRAHGDGAAPVPADPPTTAQRARCGPATSSSTGRRTRRRAAASPSQLTPLEFRILYLLAMNEGQVIPYARLVDYAWGFEGGDASLLKTHICHIRQKLGLPLDGPGAIRSLATVGYSLVKQRGRVRCTAHGPVRRPTTVRDEQPIAV